MVKATRGATISFDPRGLSQSTLSALERVLSVANPDRATAERLGSYKARFIEPRLNAWTITEGGSRMDIPYGAMEDPEVFDILSGVVEIVNDDNEGQEMSFSSPSLSSVEREGGGLYPYQQRALNGLLGAERGILVAPCGSGKTRVGVVLARALGRSCLWITHTQKLLKQSEEVWIALYGSEGVGEITEGKVRTGRNITFATVQTLSNLDRDWTEFGTVIVDECHHCAGTPTKLKQFAKVLNRINARYKFGLTATPKRQDGLFKTAKWILGGIAHTIRPSELLGRIAPEYVQVETGISYDPDLWTRPDGTIDFSKYQTLIAEDQLRNEAIARKVCDLSSKSRGQLVLCSRIAQAKDIAQRIRRRLADPEGESVSLLVGATSKKTSIQGKAVIVATYAIAKEGLDVPELDTLHFASPVKDEVAIVQAVGRISRSCEGKTSATVFDYVDSDPYAESAGRKRRRIIERQRRGRR